MNTELKTKLRNVRIKTSNLTEKIAAHYFLHGKFGTTLPGFMDDPNMLYCGVRYGDCTTDSWRYAEQGEEVIDFKDLHKFDEWFESIGREETVVLNAEYSAKVTKNGIKVGCQTFLLSIAAELQKAVAKVTK